MVGKSKRFNLERYSAILDYLISTQAEESQENLIHGHSLEYYATINSLAGEGLLKKYVMKRSAIGDQSATGAAGAGGTGAGGCSRPYPALRTAGAGEDDAGAYHRGRDGRRAEAARSASRSPAVQTDAAASPCPTA